VQKAIADIVYQLGFKEKRQMHVIPGGQGKSRIAAWVALLALVVGKVQNVHMVFTNDVLM
jgi:hypothetical protein